MFSDSKQGTQIADELHVGDNGWLCTWDESAESFNQFLCKLKWDNARDALTKPQ